MCLKQSLDVSFSPHFVNAQRHSMALLHLRIVTGSLPFCHKYLMRAVNDAILNGWECCWMVEVEGTRFNPLYS